MKRSKKYEAAQKLIDKSKTYNIDEAVKLLPQISTSKFAGSIDMEVKLNLKAKQQKEVVRGNYTLPHTFGKPTKVLAFADPTNLKDAQGADIAGGEELIDDVAEGKVEFDVVVATPAMMPKIAKLGKVLGRKGLMPSPKNGTVSADIKEAISKIKQGNNSYKSKDGKINMIVGKTDMKEEELKANIVSALSSVKEETKKLGPDILGNVKVSPTMGPAINIASS